MIELRIGFVGFGKMGQRMVSRILESHDVVVFDTDSKKLTIAREIGTLTASSLKELAMNLPTPRIIWIMVPAGSPVDNVIEGLETYLDDEDVLIDGGNSFYKDSIRRAERLKNDGIHFLDVGTSGGLEGAEKGASLTVGGSEAALKLARPLLERISKPGGLLHCGPCGAGHYVKMIHNGIEYAMLQALGEGFEMLYSAPYDLDLGAIAQVWNNGSVIRSWMLELVNNALSMEPKLDSLKGEVGGGETGRWTIETAMSIEVPIPVIALSLLMRYRSRQHDSFSAKVVAALRREFGGHTVKKQLIEG